MTQINLHPDGDYLVRALVYDDQVRMTAIRSTDTVTEAMRIHGLTPMASVALGRFMTGLQLMSLDLKNEGDSITGIIRSDGPIRGMTAIVEQDSRVRGYVINNDLETTLRSPGKLDVASAVGQGILTVIRKQAGAKPYNGNVELISGEIAEDLTYYLATSEQIPTIMGLGVNCDKNGIRQAGGYLIQAMPGAGPDVIDWLERRIGSFPDVTYWLDEGFTPAQILDLFAGRQDLRYLEVKPTSYHCTCSRERMAEALMTLGRSDFEELLEDDGATLTCEFCNKHYYFPADELRRMAAEAWPD